MSHERFTVHVGERGRFVVPAAVRERLGLRRGDLLVVEELDDHFVVRRASDVAHGFLGYLADLAPEADLAAELIADRREEAARDEKAPRRAKDESFRAVRDVSRRTR